MTKTSKNMSALGGCQVHNLHCGYPSCLTDESMQPKQSEVKAPELDYVVIDNLRFTKAEILRWREQEMALRDQHIDDTRIDIFAQAMKNKMSFGRENKKRGGWDNEAEVSDEQLARMMIEHIPKGDPVDVANFAMMLFSRGATVASIQKAFDSVIVSTAEQLNRIDARRKADTV